MFKILLALLLTVTFILYIIPTSMSIAAWRNGTGEQTILGTSQAALIGYNSYNSIVQPLDNLLSGYCTEYLQYNSSSLINVIAGSCNVSNSQGTIHLFLKDTANTVLSSSNLDTGSLTASTTYYVYATAATNAATSSTYYISASNTAPSGQTYYFNIGSFVTDANIQITQINNLGRTDQISQLNSKSINVVYQALTDGDVEGWASQASGNSIFDCYTGSISGSMAHVCSGGGSSQSGNYISFFFRVRRGDYYEVTGNSGTMNFVSTSN